MSENDRYPPALAEQLHHDALVAGRDLAPEDMGQAFVKHDNHVRAELLAKLDRVDGGTLRQRAALLGLRRYLGGIHERMQKAGR